MIFRRSTLCKGSRNRNISSRINSCCSWCHRTLSSIATLGSDWPRTERIRRIRNCNECYRSTFCHGYCLWTSVCCNGTVCYIACDCNFIFIRCSKCSCNRHIFIRHCKCSLITNNLSRGVVECYCFKNITRNRRCFYGYSITLIWIIFVNRNFTVCNVRINSNTMLCTLCNNKFRRVFARIC